MIKNLLYYFYLLCFMVLVALGLVQLFVGQEFILFALILQLIWGPIAFLHCSFLYLKTLGTKNPLRQMYAASFWFTLFYLLTIGILSSTNIGFAENNKENILFVFVIGVLPWLMLTFFTYLLYQSRKLEQKKL